MISQNKIIIPSKFQNSITNFKKNTEEEEIVYMSSLINNFHDSFKVENDIDLNDKLKIK